MKYDMISNVNRESLRINLDSVKLDCVFIYVYTIWKNLIRFIIQGINQVSPELATGSKGQSKNGNSIASITSITSTTSICSPPAQPVAHLILGVPGHVCRPRLKRSQFSSKNLGQKINQEDSTGLPHGFAVGCICHQSCRSPLLSSICCWGRSLAYKGKDNCMVRSTVPTARLSLLELFQLQEAHRLLHGSFKENDPLHLK